jgi:uncharacterized protein YukE
MENLMKHTVRVHYDEPNRVPNRSHGKAENHSQLLMNTRRKMAALRREWVGEVDDEFFEEMEIRLLPVVHRLLLSLKASQEALNEIMRTVYESDHELGRELLWREYPSDSRSSYFRQFWDPRPSDQDPTFKEAKAGK